MARHTKVILLWHMHQPLYVLPGENTALMPWVRLHCVKGYCDMVAVLNKVPEMRAVINFTPVLLQQIEDLALGRVRDAWLDLSRKDAAELETGEKLQLLEHFFKAHWDNMIRKYPRYGRLLEQRGIFFDRGRFERNPSLFSTRDYRDLQVWFNLAWCGHAMFAKHPLLSLLVAKGENFTEEEKNALLDLHMECLRGIIEQYKQAESEDRIEITTTPYFHPILPLIVDTELAHRRMPGRPLPRRFTAVEDARWHVVEAVRTHERFFGRKPLGMWPAEGSVAPEIIPLLSEAGIKVMFTDEGNLFHALIGKNAVPGVDPEHTALFQAWRAEGYGHEVITFFRERALSDFIGFNAARNPPEVSAAHVINKLAEIADCANTPNPVITLALDGENAWEAFPDGGEQFLLRLYQGLVQHQVLEPVLPRRYLESNPSCPCLEHITTGSWINSDFDIWIGDPEENAAWNLLGQTRAALLAAQARLDAPTRTAAWRSLYAAEGSDWFWWFGPDFSTDTQGLFDELFRSHLMRVYTLIGQAPPLALTQPIRRTARPAAYSEPSSRIRPVINGRNDSYFEYVGAGRYDPTVQSSAMFQFERSLSSLWFGNDGENFYLRLDWKAPFQGILNLDLIAGESGDQTLSFVVSSPPARQGQARIFRGTDVGTVEIFCVNDQILECAVPLGALLMNEGEQVSFRLRLCDESGLERERYPEAGTISFRLKDSAQESSDWLV